MILEMIGEEKNEGWIVEESNSRIVEQLNMQMQSDQVQL